MSVQLEIKSAPEGAEMDPAALIEVKAAIDAFTKSAGDRIGTLESTVGKLSDTVSGLATRISRQTGTEERKGDNEGLETKAFLSFIRHGHERLDPLEKKALRVADDAAAGYLAPDEFRAELDKNIVFYSPVRAAARQSGMSGPAVLLPKRTGRLTGKWVGETQPREATQPAYGMDRFEAAEMACYVDVSNAALEDAAYDLAAELATDFAEEFGRLESVAFVNGNGVLKPNGFMASDAIGFTKSGHASQLTADAFIDLYHAVQPAYRVNGSWGLNSTTLAAARKLKGSDGHYLLQMTPINGVPAATILGRPVIEMPDLPDVAAGTFPVIFGDFQRGYLIFDRTPLQVSRDPFTLQADGMTRFHARRRVAGGVRRAEALRKMKIEA